MPDFGGQDIKDNIISMHFYLLVPGLPPLLLPPALEILSKHPCKKEFSCLKHAEIASNALRMPDGYSCMKGITMAPKDDHVQRLKESTNIRLWGKEEFSMQMKLKVSHRDPVSNVKLMTSWERDDPGETNASIRVSLSRTGSWGELVETEVEKCNIAAFEDGAREHRGRLLLYLEVEDIKDSLLFSISRKDCRSLNTLILAWCYLCQISDLQNYKITYWQ